MDEIVRTGSHDCLTGALEANWQIVKRMLPFRDKKNAASEARESTVLKQEFRPVEAVVAGTLG